MSECCDDDFLRLANRIVARVGAEYKVCCVFYVVVMRGMVVIVGIVLIDVKEFELYDIMVVFFGVGMKFIFCDVVTAIERVSKDCFWNAYVYDSYVEVFV